MKRAFYSDFRYSKLQDPKYQQVRRKLIFPDPEDPEDEEEKDNAQFAKWTSNDKDMGKVIKIPEISFDQVKSTKREEEMTIDKVYM